MGQRRVVDRRLPGQFVSSADVREAYANIDKKPLYIVTTEDKHLHTEPAIGDGRPVLRVFYQIADAELYKDVQDESTQANLQVRRIRLPALWEAIEVVARVHKLQIFRVELCYVVPGKDGISVRVVDALADMKRTLH